MAKNSKNRGIFEYWTMPGSEHNYERASATDLKSFEAYIVIGTSVLKYRVHYVENQGHQPWKLLVNQPIGTREARDNWEPLDEFSSLRQARDEAYRRARLNRRS